jgi:DNA processing protein
VGPATFFRLLAEHGSAEAALEALPAVARSAGVADYRPCSEAAARAEVAAGQRAGARLVAFGTPAYPAALTEIADAPPLLWVAGRADLLAAPAVALVGARSASSLGLRMARALARDLGAAGWVVVSGLARGIDSAAHESALATGTIAVLAGGIDVPGAPEQAALAARIAAEGLLVSEQPVGLEPQARHFPRRNRIVSGLARAVVVVEAAARSGSLITARCALDQGREVMAVPGHPMDARAAGCNGLIREGALLVRDAADVLAALGGAVGGPAPAPPARPTPEDAGPEHATAPLPGGRRAPAARPAAPEAPGPALATRGRAHLPPSAAALRSDEGGRPPAPAAAEPPDGPAAPLLPARILALLGAAPVAEDQLMRDLGLRAEDIASDLLVLELEGLVERRPGGLIARRV